VRDDVGEPRPALNIVLSPSGTALGWAVPACFGDPRTGFRDHPVGTAPLRQAAGATSWPGARVSGIERQPGIEPGGDAPTDEVGMFLHAARIARITSKSHDSFLAGAARGVTCRPGAAENKAYRSSDARCSM
jgi:hypothetical protein